MANRNLNSVCQNLDDCFDFQLAFTDNYGWLFEPVLASPNAQPGKTAKYLKDVAFERFKDDL